jgi:hypothetical protein
MTLRLWPGFGKRNLHKRSAKDAVKSSAQLAVMEGNIVEGFIHLHNLLIEDIVYA